MPPPLPPLPPPPLPPRRRRGQGLPREEAANPIQLLFTTQHIESTDLAYRRREEAASSRPGSEIAGSIRSLQSVRPILMTTQPDVFFFFGVVFFFVAAFFASLLPTPATLAAACVSTNVSRESGSGAVMTELTIFSRTLASREATSLSWHCLLLLDAGVSFAIDEDAAAASGAASSASGSPFIFPQLTNT